MRLESIETLNTRLLETFGRFENNQPNWRIVWSEDQFEKRQTEYTDEGFKLLTPIVKELPKYRQWIHNKYILERLTPVPEFAQTELPSKLSYEPIWVFQDEDGNSLPPKWEPILLIIESVKAASAHSVGAKYKDPEIATEINETLARRDERLKDIEEDLFGNETEVGDALAHKQAVVVPGSKES